MNHHIIIMWAEVGIGFAQLGLIGWGLRRWGKDMDQRHEENERKWAERQVVLDEQAARWAAIRQGLAASMAGLGEELAKAQASRAEAGIC